MNNRKQAILFTVLTVIVILGAEYLSIPVLSHSGENVAVSSPERTDHNDPDRTGRRGGNVRLLIFQSDASNSCGRNNYVTLPKTYLQNNGVQLTEICTGTLNAAMLANYDVVYLGRSRSRGRAVAADVRNWVRGGGGIWSESCGMVDQQDPVAGGYIALEDMFGYNNRINRGDNAGGFSFSKVGNHEIWDGVNSPVSGSNGLYDSQLRDNNIAPQATRIGNANGHQSPMVNIYERGRTYSGVGGNWNSNANCQRYFLNVVKWLAVEITAHADEVAIRGHGENEKVCYAEYRSYNLSVNVTATRDLNEVSELKVFLDYNTTNATLCYNWTHQRFYKQQDPGGHVRLLVDNCTISTDSVDRWWANFSFMINFTFPHERMVDCFANVTAKTGEFSLDRFPHLFRVENDMELTGTPYFTAEFQGHCSRDDWVRGGENMTVTNLTVKYAGSMDIYPDDAFFDVRIMDSAGNEWWDNGSSGRGISFDIRSRDVVEAEEEYLITIENIPGTGICITNLTFTLRVDGEAPLPPINFICHADSFKDKETKHTNQPEMYVTWDEVEDTDSGLRGYYYSHLDNSGTSEGNLTTEREVEMIHLPEGYAPVYVWCIDNVGNIGNSSASGILVDLSMPVFRNLTPESGSWHNRTDIECSVEILDGNGSGVDGKSVEYAVSMGGGLTFDMWMPAWLTTSGQSLIPTVKHVFAEGEENYLKWRAKDVSGNGYVESAPVNIKVDITSIKFASEPVQWGNWYDTRKITSKILVSDTGSGLDLDSLQARLSTSGPSGFGGWMEIERDNITEMGSGEYEISVTCTYDEGKGNYLMFRGTDLAGNPLATSDKFNFKVDTKAVYFGDFAPDNETYSNERVVECFISVLDEGSGVDRESVEYSISKKGPGDEDFGPWKKPLNVISGNPTQVLLEVEFQWGRENYIRWKADDNIGTGDNISEPYNIWVNSEPSALIISPTADMELWSHLDTEFDATLSTDEDGDSLSFYWTSNVTSNRSLGHGAMLSAKLAPGHHTITLYATDGHGYNVSDKISVMVNGKKAGGGGSGGGGGDDDDGSGNDRSSGSGNSLLLLIIGAVVVLIILILVVLLILRKKKGDEEKAGPPASPYTHQRAMYGPQPHPYPQGQYIPGAHQGYGPLQGPGRATGQSPFQSFPPQPLMLPPAPAPNTELFLPQFTTEQGQQNLDLMALPPGPYPAEGGAGSSAEDPFSAILGMEFPSISPETQTSPAATFDGSIGEPDLSSPDVQAAPPPFPEEQPAPPEAPLLAGPEDPSLMGLDAMFDTLTGPDGAPAIAPPMPPPGEDAEVPGPKEITMQCHACGNNYQAEITVLPALLTCPVCQTQGVINSL